MEPNQNRNESRVLMGLVLVGAGALLFASKMGVPIPGWIFSWPMILIMFGIIISIKHRFRNTGGVIMVAVGVVFLLDDLIPALDFRNFLVPTILVLVGATFLFRPHGRFRGSCESGGRKKKVISNYGTENSFKAATPQDFTDEDDFIDSTAIFGGIKKIIVSKNFKGGDITCFMGGAELNLMQADAKDKMVIDVTQIFGGTKLIIPPNWNIKSEVVAVFGGIEDKRPTTTIATTPDKVLILKGISIFGGIDIRSY